MTNNPDNGAGDRAFWRRLRPTTARAEPISGFDANLAAAWLEDTLTDEEWAALEERLATNPDRVETLRAAAAAVPITAEAMPPALAAKLRAMTPGRAARPMRTSARRFPAWRRAAEWAMAAAVLIAVAVAGFDLGSATGQQDEQTVASATDEATAPYQGALVSYMPTSSVSFLVEGDGR